MPDGRPMVALAAGKLLAEEAAAAVAAAAAAAQRKPVSYGQELYSDKGRKK